MPHVVPAAFGEGRRALHERDALPLHGLRNERVRAVFDLSESGECLPQRGMVVAVARSDVPAEGPQLRLEIAQGDDLLGRLVRLELVAIDDDPERPEPLVRRGLQRLPVLSLLELAVSGHHHDAAAEAEAPLRPCDAAALGDAHAERSRVRLDSGDADVGMTVEAAEPAEAEQLLLRQDAEPVQRGVEAGDVVALRGEEDVALRVVEAELADVQLLVEEVHHDVEGAEARAEMPRAGALDGDERVEPAHVREQREAGIRIRAGRAANAVELGLGNEREVRHVRHVIRSRRHVSRGAAVQARRMKAGVTGTEYSATA